MKGRNSGVGGGGRKEGGRGGGEGKGGGGRESVMAERKGKEWCRMDGQGKE